jgi:hypothetical protein
MTARDIFNGSTGNRARILILDADGLPKTGVAFNAAGLSIAYKIGTGSEVAITLTSGNWHETGGGKYLVDVADAVYAVGNLGALVQFYGALTGSSVYGEQHRVVAYNPLTVALGANTTTPPTVGSIADAVWDEDNRDHLSAHSTGKNLDTIRKSNLLVEGTILASPAPTTTAFNVSGVNYPTGAFKHSILSFAEDATIANQNSPILTYVNNGNGTSTITIEEPLTSAPTAGDKVQIDANSHVHAISAIVSGVWSTLVSGYSSATGTMGLVVYALSTMLEFVSSIWRWKSTALSQAPSGGGGEGDYAITLVATSIGGAVPATKFSIVGTSTVVYSNSSGVAVINLDADTYTLRTTPPPGYQPVADSPLVVAADATVTKTLVAIPAPTPPSPSQCLLSVYVAKQSGSPFESVTVTARFPAGWSVASGTMAVNAVIEDVTDSTGLAQLMLYREQEYDLSFARQNGTIAKIRITTPNAASASLSQVYSP